MTPPYNSELLDAFLEDSQDVLREWERVCLQLEAGDDVDYKSLLRCAHNLKGSAGLAGFSELHARMHRIEDCLVLLRDHKQKATDELRIGLLEIESLLQKWIDGLKSNPEITVETLPQEIRLREILTNQVQVPIEDAALNKKNMSVPVSFELKSHSHKVDENIRVSAAKLDRLIQLVGEMSLHQSIIDRASQEGTLGTFKIRNVIDQKSKLTQDLQDAALSLRMIPVEGLFQKVERMIRETATKLHKQVRVERKGDNVTLDKLIVEGILDPLIHIARNAIDHGIESPDDRVQIKKLPQGLITISAENNSNGITIKFEDDGRGIDGEKVYQKALEKGLVAPEQVFNYKDKLHLIFIPGLSTAESISEISGRGVGMDVVAEVVKKMAGQLEIDSTLSKGTRIRITLPTNLSIINALIIKVNNTLYAVPNQDLEEVIDLRSHTISLLDGGKEKAINLRGHVVLIEDLDLFLTNKTGLNWIEDRGADKLSPKPGIVIEFQDERIALAVDEVLGQQQIFVRPIIGHLAPVPFFGGSTILSDGEPSIILNLPEVARHFFAEIEKGV
jgi:two-component system, chemotaxis family, sensor kinase CheA